MTTTTLAKLALPALRRGRPLAAVLPASKDRAVLIAAAGGDSAEHVAAVARGTTLLAERRRAEEQRARDEERAALMAAAVAAARAPLEALARAPRELVEAAARAASVPIRVLDASRDPEPWQWGCHSCADTSGRIDPGCRPCCQAGRWEVGKYLLLMEQGGTLGEIETPRMAAMRRAAEREVAIYR